MTIFYDLYGPKDAPKDPGSLKYMQAYPDVWNDFNKDPSSTTADNFAKNHFEKYGINENRENYWGSGSTTSDPRQNMFQPDLYSKSYSGIGEGNTNDLMSALLPRLKASFGNYRSDIDQATKAANEGFASMNRSQMKTGLQELLNNLAAKGMLNSSVASDAIGTGMANFTKANAEKGFDAAMQGAAMKAGEPALLAKIASLGSYSQSSNPLEPYKLMAQYDWATM